MKVLQVPFCFYPDPVGGTETYVLGLSRWLRKLAFAVEIAAPGTRDETYSHEGFPVHRYRVNDPAPSLLDLYGEGDAAAAGRFEALLGRVRPELLHMHAFTSGVSLRLVRVAKRYGIPVIFTYHTPAVSCQRGTLLRWGQDVCDGSLNVRVCSQCALDGMGLPRPISRIAGSLPPSIGSFIGHMGLSGGPFTVIRMADLTGARHRAFQALTAEADQIIAVCEWVQQLLVRNGVPPRKVTLSRQGYDGLQPARHPGPRSASSGPLKLAFAGRVDRTKGVDTAVRAVLRDPALPVRLDLFGVVQDNRGRQLKDSLEQEIGSDERIRFLPPLPPARIVPVLCEYDALLVPSQCLETGPMVVYEAFAAGIPVVGSDLGGIRELVRHDIDGLLVPAGSIQHWTNALRSITGDHSLLERLTSGIRAPRSMETAAAEVAGIYKRQLSMAEAHICK